MSKKQKEEKPLTEEQAAKRAAGIAASAERKGRAAQKVTKGQTDATAANATALVPAERDSVTVPGAIDSSSMDTVTFHAAAVAAVDELRGLSDQCGLVIYTKILPALTDAKRRFDAGEEVNGCNGIEQYIESFGIKPATVRKWKQRAAERELSKQVRLLTGETPKPKTKPLAYNRKQKERLLAAASIVGSELIPAYENGHDISEPMAELKKIAFDSEELTSIVDVPEKRENPLALSLARHVKRLLTERFTVRQDIRRVEVESQRYVHGVFLEGKNGGGEGTSPIDTLMDRVNAIIEELDPAAVAAERQAAAEAETARVQQRKDDCVVWLRGLLSEGACLKRDALSAGGVAGFNRPTIQEAAKKLNVRVEGTGRECLWSLPEPKPEPESSSKVAAPPSGRNLTKKETNLALRGLMPTVDDGTYEWASQYKEALIVALEREEAQAYHKNAVQNKKDWVESEVCKRGMNKAQAYEPEDLSVPAIADANQACCAGKDPGAREILSHQRARNRVRYHLFLGGEDDNAGARVHERRAVP